MTKKEMLEACRDEQQAGKELLKQCKDKNMRIHINGWIAAMKEVQGWLEGKKR